MPQSTPSDPTESLAADLGAQIPDGLDPETIKEWIRLNEMQKKEPTPAEQWRSPRKLGFVVELPSGQICRMRRTMNIVKAIKEGTLPNPLGARIQQNIDGGLPTLALQHLEGEELLQAGELINKTVALAMVQPRVELVPEDQNPELWEPTLGSISIMDIELADKLFICGVAQGGSTDLDRFRSEQEIVVEPVSISDRVAESPKRTPRAKKSSAKQA